MAETPGTYLGRIILPIFTRISTTSELIHLGDITLDIPIDVQASNLSMKDLSQEVQDVLTGSGAPTNVPDWEPATNIGEAVGPHSRACGVIPHQHGPMCHPNCPTCYT